MNIGDIVKVQPHTSIQSGPLDSYKVTGERYGIVLTDAKNFKGCLGFYDVVLDCGEIIFTGSNNLKKVVDNA